jgi:hypothetical protein
VQVNFSFCTRSSLSPFFEGFSAGTLWALVLSNLVMRSDFVQIEAARQHLKNGVHSK